MRNKGNSFGIWGTNAETRLHFRLLCVFREVTSAQLLEQLVDEQWQIESKKRLDAKKASLTKRIVKRAIRRAIRKKGYFL